MRKILGLDLGTNSIGWALVEIDHENRTVRILGLGSRILSMDAGEIAKFESGSILESSASKKTTMKTTRKLNERFLLRRDRLHCVLNLLQSLPEHYKVTIDFENEKGYRSGKFKKGLEEKIAYIKDKNGKSFFLFMDSYKEMLNEFKDINPDLFYKKKNGKDTKIPYDWTLYYLRKKALTKEISKEELAWITLSFNQKRGYEKTVGQDEKKQKEGELSETIIGIVKSINETGEKDGLKLFEIILCDENGNDFFLYKEESKIKVTEVEDLKELEIISKYDEDGNINDKNNVYIIKEIRHLKVEDVIFTGKKIKENFIYEIVLETGWVKEQQNKYQPKWINTERDFIIKTSYDVNGNRIQKGSDKGRNINAPSIDDWTLQKLKTETTLSSFNSKNKTVGVASYIYNELLRNPSQKIKGDLITVIERKYYREELEKIFDCQIKSGKHPELEDTKLYTKAINLLYPNNENHRKNINNIGFASLITDDVILYQRDLKSKKSLISNCVYEKENFKKTDTKTGKEYQEPLKAIHKANPLYQEFRIWQFIKRLKIIQLESKNDDEIVMNQDVTKAILTNTAKEKLYEFLNNREHITQSVLLKHLKLSEKDYKWNYEIDHKEPCNETRYNFILRINRVKKDLWKTLLTPENEYLIWHFFYSVKKQDEFKKGINSLFEKLLNKSGLPVDYRDDLVKNFITFGGYNNDYGTYSEKALKKLLPFLRIGKYWNQEAVEKILAKATFVAKEKVFVKEEINGEITDFQGLWISSACYLVYNRYSEVGDIQYWKTPYDIENYLRNEFKQHSLNNPVVERVLIETLQLVKDIWKYFGEQDGIDENGKIIYKELFNRIHIELGREMKKNAKEREKENKQNKENQKSNERIIELLKELAKENNEVKTKSPFQQEKLRIIENDLLSSIEYDKDATSYNLINGLGSITKKEIKDITSKDITKISTQDIERYKLWLDQRYQSPYTGKIIKLSDLFNREKYEIEHIFPQERITLNALYNKVICETEVNKDKKALTGYQYILNSDGKKSVKCAAHDFNEITILPPDEYEKRVKINFTDKRKQEILLSKEIPDEFTNSQLNNARYISKMAMKLLSNIVREEGEDSFRSKNVLPITGVITTKLKKDWQLNDSWNELIQPRFKRLNEITNSNLFGHYEKINGHDVFINQVPEELNKNFEKKRIDHRHHAMDALVIALATENQVNYLNNISSQDNKTDKLEARIKLKNIITDTKKNEAGDKSRYLLPPAQYKQNGEVIVYSYCYKETNSRIFKQIALEALANTVVSFKQKNRFIRQRTNKIQVPDIETSKLKIISQKNLSNSYNYNVRQSLHKATFYGKVKLKQKIKKIKLSEAIDISTEIVDLDLRTYVLNLQQNKKIENVEILHLLESKYPNVEVYDRFVATRYENNLESLVSVDGEKIISTIESITDISIQRILLNHLNKYNSIKVNVTNISKYVDNIIDEELQKSIKGMLLNDTLGDKITFGDKNINEIDVFTADIEFDHKEKIYMNPQLAFTFEGIVDLNKNIKELNDGKNHKPIFKVRMFTPLGTKFPVSENGEKSRKYVITADDSNSFCGFYEKTNGAGERKFIVPTLKETIENLKRGEVPCKDVFFDEKSNEEYKLIFTLTPNDLVYLPTEDEMINSFKLDSEKLKNIDKDRIYKFTDGNSAGVMNFTPYYVSKPLVDLNKKEYKEINLKNLCFEENTESKKGIKTKVKELVNEIGLGSNQSKNQNSLEGIQIKQYCIKLKIDRLGNISI